MFSFFFMKKTPNPLCTKMNYSKHLSEPNRIKVTPMPCSETFCSLSPDCIEHVKDKTKMGVRLQLKDYCGEKLSILSIVERS